MNNVTELTLTDRIKSLLDRFGSTQRWFVGQLNEAGIEMSDTKLSNRMTGAIQWTDEENKAIDEFLSKNFNI